VNGRLDPETLCLVTTRLRRAGCSCPDVDAELVESVVAARVVLARVVVFHDSSCALCPAVHRRIEQEAER
jgi:hypothetical protein